MGDSLAQSRSHYQPGYLMSVTQNSASPPGGQRHEDVPIVQTKAKLNQVLSGDAVSDFGMDSMFESSRQRQRQTLPDEDAPPTTSVNDIVDGIFPDSGTARTPQRNAPFEQSQSRPSLFRSSHPSTPKPVPPTIQPIYVVVFGYPPDKYSVTVEYFGAFGDATAAEQNTEISNCFRIGYKNAADAFRAVRKNGEVLNGSWMVGVKWADPAQAEALLGPALVRGNLQSPEIVMSSSDVNMPGSPPNFASNAARDDLSPVLHRGQETPSVGTPIRLAPSTAAFRKPGMTAPGSAQRPPVLQPAPAAAPSPSKGVLGVPATSDKHLRKITRAKSYGVITPSEFEVSHFFRGLIYTPSVRRLCCVQAAYTSGYRRVTVRKWHVYDIMHHGSRLADAYFIILQNPASVFDNFVTWPRRDISPTLHKTPRS
ncbi:hypothetical protein A0H81_13554 [Grifola frondosa]|uniref:RRM Nup35-type domain-containing protein n=1 Tax=Grifola frondosa TaxID=5627 RepID=A0A1C7LP18_GRIFR|nr:hypothetical protein A0H81_13554 [Grifola frondosa]